MTSAFANDISTLKLEDPPSQAIRFLLSPMYLDMLQKMVALLHPSLLQPMRAIKAQQQRWTRHFFLTIHCVGELKTSTWNSKL